jgi:tetratricopeptide (TPR) repeat protein
MDNSSFRSLSVRSSQTFSTAAHYAAFYTMKAGLRLRQACGVAVLILEVAFGISRPAWSAPNNSTTKATAAAKETAGKEIVTRDCKDDEAVRRSTAVTLNYCRASFYRIQKMPTLRVLCEEQEKILNNVDLNGIADQEVIKLYTGVLTEISEIRLADRERVVLQDKYVNTLGTLLTADAFDFGTQLASAHYLSAVRTGARSWWDYRNTFTMRDFDVFHVDQKRLMAFTEKSGQFLDTFWKLARDRKIPDRWLVRNQDLRNLEKAMQEFDPAVRLRVLKRMQDFMTCFPPYWYYVARTQQALGQLTQAAETYERLIKVGQGHFRKDEMLAAGLANRAMILDYLHQSGAVDAATKALGYSTDVWEANLMAAQVLGRNGRPAEAEDAILRNLDVELERDRSTVALVSLYTTTHNREKLQAWLANPAVVSRLPMPTLIRAAAVLGPRRIPTAVVAQWASTVQARYDINLGADDFVLVTTPAWKLQSSEMSLVVGKESSRQSTIALSPAKSEVRFGRIRDVGHPFYGSSNPPGATLLVKFPDAPLVRLRLESRPEIASNATSSFSSVVEMLTPTSLGSRHQALQLAAVEIGEEQFAVAARLGAQGMAAGDDGPPAAPPVSNGAGPAKVDTSPNPSTPPAASLAAPQSVAAPTTAAPQSSLESAGRATSRAIAFPPIPLLNVPHFAVPQAINSGAGPEIPDPHAAPEGPLFE